MQGFSKRCRSCYITESCYYVISTMWVPTPIVYGHQAGVSPAACQVVSYSNPNPHTAAQAQNVVETLRMLQMPELVLAVRHGRKKGIQRRALAMQNQRSGERQALERPCCSSGSLPVCSICPSTVLPPSEQGQYQQCCHFIHACFAEHIIPPGRPEGGSYKT